MCSKFKLVIVRHGETEFNKLKLMQGHMDVSLNDLGKLQASKAGKHLNNMKFDLAYSSDLVRAKETCKLLLCKNNDYCESHKTKPEIKLDKRLRERTFGSFEGKPAVELIDAAQKAGQSVAQFSADGCESQQDLKARAKSFFISLCKEINTIIKSSNIHNDYHALLVSHGGFIKALFAIWLEAFTFDKGSCVVNNCIVTNASRSCVTVTLPEVEDLMFQLTENKICKKIAVTCNYFNESV